VQAVLVVSKLIGAYNHDFGIQALLSNRNWTHLMNEITLFLCMYENIKYTEHMLPMDLLDQSHSE